MESERGPVAVIVPAHNEERVIDRCLNALLEGSAPGELVIVVVCNGCHDQTVARARQHPGVQVLELAEASKSAALNAGDQALGRLYPRFYVDADVELPLDGLRRVAAELSTEGALCAAPRPVFNLASRPYVVRAFYRVWTQLPFLTEQPVGNGVYALNEAGRSRFDCFPDITSDDLFVRNLFTSMERRVVDDAVFIVHTPTRVSGLIRMRVRVHRGNREWRQTYPGSAAQAGDRGKRLASLLCRPEQFLGVAVYLSITILARAIARWRELRNVTTWERDESAREADVA